ncbi:hypothetical protein [Novosphingobium rosa]|uniref:hypothetical protein n=1 Tax=Novosphingobium rosa TaxID=76978 RepID=UPI000830E9D2|nr:hypothetical protein [Novosphingobium rosa]
MNESPREAAWQRIEAALTRLDAAARDRRDAATLELRLHEEQERHQALRGALRETLGRLDALIVSHTSDGGAGTA